MVSPEAAEFCAEAPVSPPAEEPDGPAWHAEKDTVNAKLRTHAINFFIL
jgi:hypothetical protein